MDLFDAIARRHSYRGDFTTDPVPRDVLTKVVTAGMQAPSGKNAQTTTFVIVDEHETLDQLAKIVDKPYVTSAKAMIVCVSDPAETLPGGGSYHVEDCAAAVENMLLAIEALGYCTVWIGGPLREGDIGVRIRRLLEVPQNHEVRALLPIGKPMRDSRQPDKRPFEQRAWFNRYGGGEPMGEGVAPWH